MADLKGADRFDYEVVKLMRLMDTDDMMLQMLEIGLETGTAQIEAEMPDFPLTEFIERVRQRVDIDSLLYHLVPLYSRYYTREEITGLIAFYETPLGRKLVKDLPQITQEMLAASQAWIERLVEEMDKDFNSIS